MRGWEVVMERQLTNDNIVQIKKNKIRELILILIVNYHANGKLPLMIG